MSLTISTKPNPLDSRVYLSQMTFTEVTCPNSENRALDASSLTVPLMFVTNRFIIILITNVNNKRINLLQLKNRTRVESECDSVGQDN